MLKYYNKWMFWYNYESQGRQTHFNTELMISEFQEDFLCVIPLPCCYMLKCIC